MQPRVTYDKGVDAAYIYLALSERGSVEILNASAVLSPLLLAAAERLDR